MTNEKKERVNGINKKNILFLLGALVIVGSLIYVYAVTTIQTPKAGGNYSRTMYVNCTTNLNITGGGNASFYYNASGGPAYNSSAINMSFSGLLVNQSYNDTNYNFTLDIGWMTDSRTYNITCMVNNGTAQEWSSITNVTIDNTPPSVVWYSYKNNYTTGNLTNNGNYSNASTTTGELLFMLNVSVNDTIVRMGHHKGSDGIVYFNASYSNGTQLSLSYFNFTNVSRRVADYYNMTLNATTWPDGHYNVSVWTTDAMNTTDTGIENISINNTEEVYFTIDRTAPPIPVLTNTTSTTTTSIVATITSNDATSGTDLCVVGGFSSGVVVTERGSNTQTVTHTGLTCGTSYTYDVICYDQVGFHNHSATTSLSTKSCSISDGPGGGGGGTTTTAIEKKYVLSIEPATEGVLSNFPETMGVDEIKIRVNEEADNVQITVKKFDTEPAEITVSKTGQVHKYFQITTVNLGSKLEGATLRYKVQKNWLTDNSLDKASVGLYRFDESAGKWNEMTSTYVKEDDTYYYYDAQVPGFSYFAIGEKTVVLPEAPEEETPEEELTTETLLTFLQENWVWLVVGVVVVLVVVGGVIAKSKMRRKR